MIIVLFTAIMAKYIDNNGDSFIDINDFDSEDKGVDVDKPEDDDADPTIPLSNTPLETIIEEDETGNRPVFSPQQKRGLSLGQRIQALYQLNRRDPVFKIINDTRVKK